MSDFEVHAPHTLRCLTEKVQQLQSATRDNDAMLEQWRVWSWKMLQDLMRLDHHKDVLRKELRHASQALARISETHPEYRADYEQAVKVLEETK